MSLNLPTPKAILFDFDGTLADTAPDLVEATQAMLRSRHLPEMPHEILRRTCSSGARGLIGAAFGVAKDTPEFEPLRQEFLANYTQVFTRHTRLFAGVRELLLELNTRDIPWGIVTNKATDLTTPIVQAILHDVGLHPVTVVCGDTTAHAKPHPAPMHHACAALGVAAESVWYLGDDRRDMQAAQAAGCVPIAVSFGYHPESDPPETWGALAVLAAPLGLLGLLTD